MLGIGKILILIIRRSTLTNSMSSSNTYLSPLDKLYHWENNTPDKIFLRQPINGAWKTWTWKEAGMEIRQMAAALKGSAVKPGSHIAILSKNCAHWIMADLAILMAGHVSVPLYPNLTASTIQQILEHSEASMVFVGKLDGWAQMKAGIPEKVQMISFPYYGPNEGWHWDDLLAQQEPLQDNPIRADHELATLIYTSGSTGMPKGVMHKMGNFGFAATNAVEYIGLTPDERFFSYLPLAHIAERFFVEQGALYSGGQISFAESLDSFLDNLREAKPTLFLGVPRIWKKFQEGILSKLAQPKLNVLLSIPILSSFIKKKIRKGFGFEDTRIMYTGASPIPEELLRWYRKIGFVIAEGYAMTENFAYSFGSLIEEARPGFVGHLLEHVDLKFDANDEILIRHQGVMDGYYKDPELTKATFTEDGFLRTGDRGKLDEAGYLRIIGRTKEVFKTSKGKYVVPGPIEMKVGDHADVEMSFVTGEALPQPIVLITLTEHSKQRQQATMIEALSAHIKLINASLDAHEKIGKAIIIGENWTIENNLLTPTLKLKRNELDGRYAAQYESWYQEEALVIAIPPQTT